jgi:hypothetical protein
MGPDGRGSYPTLGTMKLCLRWGTHMDYWDRGIDGPGRAGFVSHLRHDEAVPKMGHPRVYLG